MVYTVGTMSDVTGSSLAHGKTQEANTVFNILDEKQIITLLRHVHKSPLSPDIKNTLRDALFAFTSTSGTHPPQSLVSLFAEYGFVLKTDTDTPSQPNTSSNDATKHPSPLQEPMQPVGFGRPRPHPHFFAVGSVATDQMSEDQPSSVAQKENASASAAHTNTPVTKEHSVRTQETISHEGEVLSASTPAPVPAPEVVTDSAIIDTKNTSTEVVVDTTTPSATDDIEAVVSNEKSVQDPSTRIKEIKKEVNALVGNPVNLIDVHNEIGREYMNALLDAMKKNNGGNGQELQQAMDRLEQAFSAVKNAIGNEGLPVQSESQQTTKNTDTTDAPALTAEHKKEPMPTTPATSAYDSNAPLETKAPQQDQEVPVATVSEDVSTSVLTSVHTSHIEKTDTPSVSPTLNNTSSTPNTSEASITHKEVPTPDADTPLSPDALKTETSVQNENNVSEQNSMISVAKQKQIQDIMTAKKQEAATTQKQQKALEMESMDPLMTPEVTNGLQQLLSEWSLFKSSGLFGTGPNGMEHPLYKKLAKLTMTAVVAGRYEGATPQIKRSITDYMNGWRYEEGILQEQGELFEHYLRRVIKHILDKRKKK